MNRFDIALTAEGLTAYAIERQNGWERHQPEGAPPWMERRRFWTDTILQGMARLQGACPDPKLLEQFDCELEQSRRGFAAVPVSLQLQRETIRSLRNFVSALETAGGDRRQQINVVRELLEDVASHLPWAGADNGLDLARNEAERALRHMTAQMPIRFTRILLGGDAGPWVDGFVSGAVTDAETIQRTAIYNEAVRRYPEVTDWPALCTVYTGRDLTSAQGTVDASAFDLEIMNQAGDSFLKEDGIHLLGGVELRVTAYDSICVLKVEPGQAPEMVTMPNTLDAFQATVGGDIETVGLDANAVLVCNEEGKLAGLPANRQVGGDTIAGTFLIVGAEDGEFCSLSDADAAHYAEKFAEPIPVQEGPTTWEFHVF